MFLYETKIVQLIESHRHFRNIHTDLLLLMIWKTHKTKNDQNKMHRYETLYERYNYQVY